VFDVEPRREHFDKPSIRIFGEYVLIDYSPKITYGHSKDKRQNLKQFPISMLYVGCNFSIIGSA
jgi:hypothetical protein